ncbi:unnamed protein product, partial [Scytosiphon promiscuus]
PGSWGDEGFYLLPMDGEDWEMEEEGAAAAEAQSASTPGGVGYRADEGWRALRIPSAETNRKENSSRGKTTGVEATRTGTENGSNADGHNPANNSVNDHHKQHQQHQERCRKRARDGAASPGTVEPGPDPPEPPQENLFYPSCPPRRLKRGPSRTQAEIVAALSAAAVAAASTNAAAAAVTSAAPGSTGGSGGCGGGASSAKSPGTKSRAGATR